jgi:large subunit ribosomal protein L6
MSRIGKQPIAIPDSVKLTGAGSQLTVEGPKGKLSHKVPDGIVYEHKTETKELLVTRVSESRPHRELHGLTRTIISNMVVGVTEGYKKELEIHGIGYTAKLNGNKLDLLLGFANIISVEIPSDLKVEVIAQTNPGRVLVSGCDKQRVGQLAATIRSKRKPEPYQGKGVRYTGEAIRRKAGKAFVGAG